MYRYFVNMNKYFVRNGLVRYMIDVCVCVYFVRNGFVGCEEV